MATPNSPSSSKTSKPQRDLQTPLPPISELPIDIFFDILSRLPIQDLSGCRYVSKSWLQAIRNPSFAALYDTKHNNPTCLIIRRGNVVRIFNNERIDSLQGPPRSYPPSLPRLHRDQQIKSIYSCNGLILLITSRQPYYICNPITGDHIALPISTRYQEYHIDHSSVFGFGYDPVDHIAIPMSARYQEYHIDHSSVFRFGYGPADHIAIPISTSYQEDHIDLSSVFGFGYDPVSQLAKVVWVAYTRGDAGGASCLQVYDLRARGSWSVTDERDVSVRSRASGEQVSVGSLRLFENKLVPNVFVNGALHWISNPRLGLNGIVSFELASEEFLYIPPPPALDGVEMDGRKEGQSLFLLEGCLALSNWITRDRVELWMMTEYGLSWERKFIVGNPVLEYRYPHPCKLIKLLPNEEVSLISYANIMGYYHHERQLFWPIKIGDLGERRGELYASHHVRSLVSPKYVFAE